jgi:hypothetical protein
MPKLVVSIPQLGMSAKADDARQLYVLAFACDLNIKENKEAEIIGGANKNLPELLPDIANKDALNYTLASVSNIFHVTKSFRFASLTGSGIIIYPNLDPKGFFALQLFVIESDDNHRRLGEKLKKVFADEQVKGVIGELKKAITNPLIGSLMGAFASVVPTLFKDSSDDLLFSHGHSGFDFDNYGVIEGRTTEDFPLRNKIVDATLRVRIRD